MAVALVQDFDLSATGATVAVTAGSTLVNVNGRAIDVAGLTWSINASHQLLSVSAANDWLTKQLYFPDAGGPYTQQTLTKYAGAWTTVQKLTAWICYDPATSNAIWATFNLTSGSQVIDIYVQQAGVATKQTTNIVTSAYVVPGSTNSHKYALCISNSDQPGKIVASLYDITLNSGAPILTTADANVIATTTWSPTTIPITSGKFADAGFNTTGNRTERIYMQGNALATNPPALLTSATTSVALTGLGASWTPGTPGTPTFTISGVAGVSIASQVVNSSTTATLSIVTGLTTGNAVITDPSTGFTVTVPVAAPTTLLPGVPSLTSVSNSAIAVTWTTPSGGRPPYTLQNYRGLTSDFTPGGGNALSNGSGVSGATAAALTDGSSSIVYGTPYYYKQIVTDSEPVTPRTATSQALGSQLTGQVLKILDMGDSLKQRLDGDAVTPTTTDALGYYLQRLYGLPTPTMVNAGHSSSTTTLWLPANTSSKTATTTGTVADTAPTQTSFKVTVAGLIGDQLSGCTITFTSGTQNGKTATVARYNFQTTFVLLTGGNMTGAPANADTFTISNQQNYINAAISAGNQVGVNIANIMLGTNDSWNGVSAATHGTNLSTIIAALFSGIGTLTKVILEASPYYIPGLSGSFTDTTLAVLYTYRPVEDALCNGSTIVRGDTTLYAYFSTHQSELLSDGVHPTQDGVRSNGLARARGTATALKILPSGTGGGGSSNSNGIWI